MVAAEVVGAVVVAAAAAAIAVTVAVAAGAAAAVAVVAAAVAADGVLGTARGARRRRWKGCTRSPGEPVHGVVRRFLPWTPWRFDGA